MAGYWFPHDQKKNELFISSAVKAQEKVGALQINHPAKKGISLEEATKRHNAIMKSGGYHQDSSGKSITPHPTTSGSLKSQDAAQQKVVNKFKGASKLTPANIATAANAATGVLNALDMLTGGQDTILPGSGHTYSSGYNPEMYIGRTV